MRFFLRLKHWQVFSLVFLIPVVLISGGFIGFSVYGNMASMISTTTLGVFISQCSVYAWLWAVGNNFQSEERKTNTTLFKTLIIVPSISLILILFFLLTVTFKINTGIYSMYNVLFTSLFIIIPVQFLFIISMLYCFHFTAGAIKSTELKQNAKFEDFFKEFMLILFLPFGIWILQPFIRGKLKSGK